VVWWVFDGVPTPRVVTIGGCVVVLCVGGMVRRGCMRGVLGLGIWCGRCRRVRGPMVRWGGWVVCIVRRLLGLLRLWVSIGRGVCRVRCRIRVQWFLRVSGALGSWVAQSQ
jgi:hypothetical protein